MVALKSPSRARKSAPRNSCTMRLILRCCCWFEFHRSGLRELFAQSIVDVQTHKHTFTALQSRPPRIDSINSPWPKQVVEPATTRRKSRRNFTSSFLSWKYSSLQLTLTSYFINGFWFGSLLPRQQYLSLVLPVLVVLPCGAHAAICGLIFLLLKNSFHTPFHF